MSDKRKYLIIFLAIALVVLTEIVKYALKGNYVGSGIFLIIMISIVIFLYFNDFKNSNLLSKIGFLAIIILGLYNAYLWTNKEFSFLFGGLFITIISASQIKDKSIKSLWWKIDGVLGVIMGSFCMFLGIVFGKYMSRKK